MCRIRVTSTDWCNPEPIQTCKTADAALGLPAVQTFFFFLIIKPAGSGHGLYLKVPASWRALRLEASRSTQSPTWKEFSSCFFKRLKRRFLDILRKEAGKQQSRCFPLPRHKHQKLKQCCLNCSGPNPNNEVSCWTEPLQRLLPRV